MRKGLVRDLNQNSKPLINILRPPTERGAYSKIVSFYEELCLHGVTILVSNAHLVGYP